MNEPPQAILVPPGDVSISATSAGEITIAPPTFLERWGVVFVAVAGAWILLVATGLLIYYLRDLPGMPPTSSLTADQVRDALAVHKQVADQWRDSVGYVFDLLVTKTTLPIVTLLLGYLFGKKSS